MLPSEMRDRVYLELMQRFTGDRCLIHQYMLERFVPMTCREIADQMDMDLNSVAPRICEMVKTGLVRMVGHEGRRGTYEAVPFPMALDLMCEQIEAARIDHPEQVLMPI